MRTLIAVVLLISATALLMGPAVHSREENAAGTQIKKRYVIEAKKSKTLAPLLNAVAVTGADLIGTTKEGHAIVEVSDPQQVKKFATAAAITNIKEEVPVKFDEVYRLVVLCKKDKKLTAAQLKQQGFQILRYNKAGNFYVVTTTEKRLKAKSLLGLASAPAVRFVEPDVQMHIPPRPKAKQIANVPNDPLFSELWGMQNINAPIAWKKVTYSPVVVAVIDSGVDYLHPDLVANMWRNPNEAPDGKDNDGNGIVDDIHGADFVDDDGDPMDENDHGTHCAGTIGGVGNNGRGVTGVNWKVQIMGLRFLDAGGSGWTSDAIDCIDYARENGAKIMSNSWGGVGFSQALQDAITRAETAGILFIAAAGNSNQNADINPHFPSSYKNDNIISVLAIDSDDRRNRVFSNWGPKSVDIGAPGGQNVVTGTRILSTIRNNKYDDFWGTSMATPHVAGAAALMYGHPRFKNASWQQVKNALFDNARRSPDLKGRCVTGATLDIDFLGQ